MKIKKLFALFLLPFLFASCDEELFISSRAISGSGRYIEINKSFRNFEKLYFTHAVSANVKYGDEYEVKIIIDDNLENYLITDRSDNALFIGLENDHNYNDYKLEVDITMPDVNRIEGSGATQVWISGFEFEHFIKISLSGASKLKGTLTSGDAEIDLSGASAVDLNGIADDLDIEASGASMIYCRNFKARDVQIMLSGASLAYIYSERYIDASLSGASFLTYYGPGDIRSLNVSGASVVKKGD